MIVPTPLPLRPSLTAGDRQGALDQLANLRCLLDSEPQPLDWMSPSPETTQLFDDTHAAIGWIELEM